MICKNENCNIDYNPPYGVGEFCSIRCATIQVQPTNLGKVMSIKDMVKDKRVNFIYYREGELWYITECGFEFPVPTWDTGTAFMKASDKAILFMRWIRKHIEYLEKAQTPD